MEALPGECVRLENQKPFCTLIERLFRYFLACAFLLINVTHRRGNHSAIFPALKESKIKKQLHNAINWRRNFGGTSGGGGSGVCCSPPVSGSVCHSLAGVTNLLSDYPIWIHTEWLSIPPLLPKLLWCAVYLFGRGRRRGKGRRLYVSDLLYCFSTEVN